MEASTRPYAAVPPEAAEALRPVLPGLADETIAAIAREVPGYSRALEGEFGQIVRLGVEVAFNRFVDLLADPSPDSHEARATYVNLGRGEFHAGRSLDTLLAAYRVGARLAWRRFVEAGVEAGLSPPVIYSLGEAIFAYIDELSAESAEGYAEEQSAAAGESERRRRRLVRLLSQHPPASQETVRTAAARRGLDAAAGRRRRAGRGDGRRRRAGRGAPGLDRRPARAPARRGRDRRGGLRRLGRVRPGCRGAGPAAPARGHGRRSPRHARPDRPVDAVVAQRPARDGHAPAGGSRPARGRRADR